jgi:hypothetical protein
MSNNVTEKKLTLNEWAKKYEVSSRYYLDTREKREFQERLENARYLQSIGQWQPRQEAPPETHSITDRMVKVVSHMLALYFN